jgi:hypothetical protein
MKDARLRSPALCLLASVFMGCQAARISPSRQTASKNVADVSFRTLPSDPLEVLRTSDWNFNFRPYGKSASGWLASDPKLQRAAAAGETTDENLTALSVACDAEGFTVSVLCTDASLARAYASTNALASPTVEMFVAPGDADDEKIVPHYMTAGTMADTREYPDLVQDRDYRHIRPYMTCTEEVLDNGFLCRIRYDWEVFRDCLPVFSDRTDNFWRLSVIRWSDGGRTWGGPVHQFSQAGYIRWPQFTDTQKTAILAATLRKGWVKFNAFIQTPEVSFGNSYRDPQGWSLPWKEAEQKRGRSYVNPNEDPAFRSELQRLVAAGKALAPQLAAFGQMAPGERDAFYWLAQDRLFNIGYDLKAAEGRYNADKIFGRK